MFPLVLLLGVGLLVLAASQDEKPSHGGGSGGGGGGGPGLPPGVPQALPCPGMANLPPQLKSLLMNYFTAGNAPGLHQAAAMARQYGQNDLADCIEAEADRLDALQAGGGGGGGGGGATGDPWSEDDWDDPSPGGDQASILDMCPEASVLPPDVIAEIDGLLAQGDPAAASLLQQAAAAATMSGMSELANCLYAAANATPS